uniref:Uncharacterized protein n=1 Tax=Eutreptiella gymnastica TaxID=73025 RepID=A0A6T1YYC1_9EUGL
MGLGGALQTHFALLVWCPMYNIDRCVGRTHLLRGCQSWQDLNPPVGHRSNGNGEGRQSLPAFLPGPLPAARARHSFSLMSGGEGGLQFEVACPGDGSSDSVKSTG